MKRYLLFSGDFYYPEGGWMDFAASFSSLEEAKKVTKAIPDDWFQIVDTHIMEVIASRE